MLIGESLTYTYSKTLNNSTSKAQYLIREPIVLVNTILRRFWITSSASRDARSGRIHTKNETFYENGIEKQKISYNKFYTLPRSYCHFYNGNQLLLQTKCGSKMNTHYSMTNYKWHTSKTFAISYSIHFFFQPNMTTFLFKAFRITVDHIGSEKQHVQLWVRMIKHMPV